MYSTIKSLHSFLPYLLIAGLLASVLVFVAKRFGARPFKKADKTLALVTLILAHLQLVVGLILYFISPIVKTALASGEVMKNATYRLYAVEHISVMILAIVFITIGYSKAKRKTEDSAKFQTLWIFYAIGLVLVLSRIPWDVWPSTSL
tara:strand:- start:170 stop:613 length:444 start_codon:yes stop_codon:yes gene_type:complete